MDAHSFAQQHGLNLIPLAPKDKKPQIPWDEYQTRQSTTIERRAWANQYEGCNWAYITGRISNGLVVIDFDDEKIYQQFYNPAKIEADTTVVKTGKGVHVYLTMKNPPTNKPIRIRSKEVMTVKGEGGYVVAPGSIHPNGRLYEFKTLHGKIANYDGDLIQEIRERLRELGYRVSIGEPVDIEKLLDGVDEPGRNDAAIKIASFYRHAKEDKEKVYDRLRIWNKKNKPPLPENDIKAVVESAYQKETPYKYRYKKTPKANKKDDVEYATRLWLDDGRYAEEIYTQEKGAVFLIYDPKTRAVEYADKISLNSEDVVNEVTVLPIPVDDTLRAALTLPDGIMEYDTVKKLREEMLNWALEQFDPVDNPDLFKLAVHLMLTTWVAGDWQEEKGEKFMPLLHPLGPSETGKKRFLTIARTLCYRGLYGLKSVKIPSLFRALDPWKGTLILDEADIEDSELDNEFIQFLNSRADGVPIPRYNTENSRTQWFHSFGMSVLATRRPYSDDGLESRCVVFPSESTNNPEKYDLLPPSNWVEKGRILQRKLMMFRLRHLKGDMPSQLIIPGINAFRVRESLLCLQALSREDPEIITDLEKIAHKLEERLIQERAGSPEGLVLNYIYGVLEDSGCELEPWHTGYQIMRQWEDKEGNTVIAPLLLSTISDGLGKALDNRDVAKFWRGLGQRINERARKGKRLYRGVLVIQKPQRLTKEFKKYVYNANNVLDRLLPTQLQTTINVPSVPDVPPIYISLKNINHKPLAYGLAKGGDSVDDGTCGTHGTVAHDVSQFDIVVWLMDAIREADKEFGMASIRELIVAGKARGLSELDVVNTLDLLRRDGRIYQPKDGYVKVV